MSRRDVQFGDTRYPIYSGAGCVDEIADRLLTLDADRFVVVLDATIAELHERPLIETLSRRAPVTTLVSPGGEAGKTLDEVTRLLELAVASGMTRRSCVVAFGGGVIGNIAGLLAALAFRGVRLVHLPTTLVALTDSVLSFKQAVNSRYGKNIIGTFHPPVLVLADFVWLRTLPIRERRSGLCEMVKNALAISPEYCTTLRDVLSPDCSLGDEELSLLLEIATMTKSRVMIADAREQTTGLVLEYGHTVGHGLELASEGRLSHGEAVGLGMLCAGAIGHRLFDLSAHDLEMHERLLDRIGVGPHICNGLSAETVMKLVRFDNKRGYVPLRTGHVSMIILAALGRPHRVGERPLTQVPLTAVEAEIEALCAESIHA